MFAEVWVAGPRVFTGNRTHLQTEGQRSPVWLYYFLRLYEALVSTRGQYIIDSNDVSVYNRTSVSAGSTLAVYKDVQGAWDKEYFDINVDDCLPQSACSDPAAVCRGRGPPAYCNRDQHAQLSAPLQPKARGEEREVKIINEDKVSTICQQDEKYILKTSLRHFNERAGSFDQRVATEVRFIHTVIFISA